MIRRVESKAGRFYLEYDEAGRLVRQGRSTTEVLSETKPVSPGLLMYYGNRGYENGLAYRNERRELGTALHVALRKYLEGERVDTTNALIWDESRDPNFTIDGDPFDAAAKSFLWTREAVQMFRGAVAWCEENIQSVIACESPAVSVMEDLPVGGTVDLVYIDKDGRLGLIDWKATSQLDEDAEIQVSVYALLLGSSPEVVALGRLYDWRKEPTIQFKPVNETAQKVRLEQFRHRFEAWKLSGGVVEYRPDEPTPRIFQSERFGKKVEVVA